MKHIHLHQFSRKVSDDELKNTDTMSSKITTDQDDARYETEEIYVYVDLDTKLLDDQLTNSNAKIKFLGIDTENPIMQLNNQLFKGNFTCFLLWYESQWCDDALNQSRANSSVDCVLLLIANFASAFF